jgi:MFS family permease
MDAIRRSLRLLKIEAVLTGTLIAMPIMVPFYHSIGMDQGQIGLSQAIFTAALLLLNIPTGWIADRFSRKLSNALGDLGCAMALLYYAQANSFTDVIVAEVVFGIAAAFSQGADSALLRVYTQLLDRSGKLFRRENASIATWQPIAQIVALMIGGVVGAFNPRLAIAISAAPYIIGCALSLCMKEEGARLVSVHRNPLRDMARVTKESIGTDPYLRWLIAAFSIGREATHVLIWALTPLLLLAGVPAIVVGVGWVINSLMVAVGAKLAHRFAEPLGAWQRFIIPMCLVVIGLSVMSIHVSLSTVWLYILIGIAQGWASATLLPMVQAEAPDSQQASVVSITRSAAQLLYIPLVWLVSYAGNFDIRYSMIATIVVFLPMTVIATWRLIVLERR